LKQRRDGGYDIAMFKRTLIIALVFIVFSIAVTINLAILDLLSIQELKESLGKISAIIAVSTAAIILMLVLVRFWSKRPSNETDR
jgi:hypothetical protein